MPKKPLCNNARRFWCIDTSVANIAEGNSCPITGHVLRKAPISPKTSLLRTHPARGGRRGFQDSIRHRLVVSTLALRAEDAMNAALPSWFACKILPASGQTMPCARLTLNGSAGSTRATASSFPLTLSRSASWSPTPALVGVVKGFNDRVPIQAEKLGDGGSDLQGKLKHGFSPPYSLF